MIKKLAITAAAGAMMLASAAGAFAYYHPSSGTFDSYNSFDLTKTITVNKAEVNNSADISNNVMTTSNTGFNFTVTKGGDTSSFTLAKTGEAEGNTTAGDASGYSTGGSATGGNTSGNATAASLTGGGNTGSWVGTGDSSASSTVSNVVNTTFIHF